MSRISRRRLLATGAGTVAGLAASSAVPLNAEPGSAVTGQDVIRHRTVRTNGINMYIAESGKGPTVLLHGFPEIGYSWRHQLPALAAAGFHAVAPDLRGYGCPPAEHLDQAWPGIGRTAIQQGADERK